MTYSIHKVGVIGSGTMGGGIATLLAGIGFPVVLIDVAAKDNKPGDAFNKRNAIPLDNLNNLKKNRIPAFFQPEDAERIAAGNLDNNLDLLCDCDWIIEGIVEKIDIKQV